MTKIIITSIFLFLSTFAFSQKISKTFFFDKYSVSQMGNYQIIDFDDCLQTAEVGNPVLPYFAVKMLLPQGTKADKISIRGENLTEIEGKINLYPRQTTRPLSYTGKPEFVVNRKTYSQSTKYPTKQEINFDTQFLDGYAICLSTFTPLVYNPKDKKASFYKKITVEIEYSVDAKSEAIGRNAKKSTFITKKLEQFVQNSELLETYQVNDSKTETYDILIVTGSSYVNSFSSLSDFYLKKGLKSEVKSMPEIYAQSSGTDNAEKLRNYIISEYQTKNISYVILGGDVEIVPYRGLYGHVLSGVNIYEDDNIPSDYYFSALDGTWNTDGDTLWGEADEDDLLPEIAVGRMPFSSVSELNKMLNKTLKYQQTPVLGELNNPLLVDEFLYSDPETWGADYLDLLIGNHSDNGYTTTGIPASDPYETLYERDGNWNHYAPSTLITEINTGHPFIYHCGHANWDYVMGLSNSDITNENFNLVNGTTHNYTFVYTHGCICGSFDNDDCIGEEMVKIDNFLAGFIGNSRYGWFNEGQTEGPSAHIQREFVDALYDQKIENIGLAHAISKLNTAPWVEALEQWEEGAMRWCFYDCNVLADPVLSLWIANPYNVNATYNSTLNINDDFAANVKINGLNTSNYMCSVFQNGVFIGEAVTDLDGNVLIDLDNDLVQTGSATLIVSGYNILNTEYQFTVVSGTSIENNLEAFTYTIFPNPVDNLLTLSYETKNNTHVRTEIFDALGRRVKMINDTELPAGRYNENIDLSSLNGGIYFLKLKIGDKSYRKQLIKL